MLLSFGMLAWTDFRSVTLSVATDIARLASRVGPKHHKSSAHEDQSSLCTGLHQDAPLEIPSAAIKHPWHQKSHGSSPSRLQSQYISRQQAASVSDVVRVYLILLLWTACSRTVIRIIITECGVSESRRPA